MCSVVIILCSKCICIGYNWLCYISMKMQTVLKQLLSKLHVVFPKCKKGGYVVKKILVNATHGNLKAWNEACEHS